MAAPQGTWLGELCSPWASCPALDTSVPVSKASADEEEEYIPGQAAAAPVQ